MVTGYIYIYTHKDGRKYVGKTTKTIEQRDAQHVKGSKQPKYYFQRALHKHGREAFDLRVCETVRAETLTSLHEQSEPVGN